jgi:hypothetical protein
VIALPTGKAPLKVTVAEAFPLTAVTVVGGEGVPDSTLLDGTDAVLDPTPLVAFTVNVYDVPSVKPATVIGLAEPVPVNPPEDDVTV